LVGMGIPEYEAKRYEGHVKNWGVLFPVHCDTSEEITRARRTCWNRRARKISARTASQMKRSFGTESS